MKMNNKNLQFIKLFALGYSLKTIAYKQGVCVSTTRDRLHRFKAKYPCEFENACSLRRAHKQLKFNLENPISIDDVAGLI